MLLVPDRVHNATLLVEVSMTLGCPGRFSNAKSFLYLQHLLPPTLAVDLCLAA